MISEATKHCQDLFVDEWKRVFKCESIKSDDISKYFEKSKSSFKRVQQLPGSPHAVRHGLRQKGEISRRLLNKDSITSTGDPLSKRQVAPPATHRPARRQPPASHH